MYDLIIIGGGPGGYAAAILGSKKGLSVLLVEKEKVGGVCLNKGCIPTKTLLSYAKLLEKAGKEKKNGILEGDLAINWSKLQGRKEKVVNTLVQAVERSIKKNGGDIIKGKGRLLSPGVVEVGNEVFEAKNILIATGSLPVIPSSWGDLLSGENALKMENLPEKVVVVGGGVVGVETAFWLRGLGVDVEIVEMMPVLIPQADVKMSELLKRELKKRKIKLHLSSPVEKIEKITGGYVVEFQEKKIEAEEVVVALGRKPVTGWEGQCIDKDQHGWIEVDEFWRTSMPGHFAVGDITGKGMLAHSAYFGAEQVIRIIVGEEAHPFVEHLVPRVVFTEPEIAWVGYREVDLKEKDIDFGVVVYQMRGTGRALAENNVEGEVVVYYERKDKKLLGIHIAGHGAGELIHTAVLALNQGLKIKELESMIASHPTFSEGVKEAFAMVDGWNIHGG